MDSAELEERFTSFAVRVICLVRALPNDVAGREVGRQLLRSASSAAANYRATRRARSDREFFAKMSIVLEEIDEAEHWLSIIRRAELLPSPRCDDLFDEAGELTRIIAATRKKLRSDG